MFMNIFIGIIGFVSGLLTIYCHLDVSDGEVVASWTAFISGACLTLSIYRVFMG